MESSKKRGTRCPFCGVVTLSVELDFLSSHCMLCPYCLKRMFTERGRVTAYKKNNRTIEEQVREADRMKVSYWKSLNLF